MSRVLAIDDDGALRSDLAQQLRAWGYEVIEAADGHAGLEAIVDWCPDIVLSDIDMPYMSGYDLIAAVSQAGREHASIGFFFITSMASRQNVLSGLGVGADEYLVKPIDYEMLRTRLSGYLRKRDMITERNANDAVLDSVGNAAASAAAFVSVATITGIFGFLVLYAVKSVLGYDLMPDAHLIDLLLGRS